MVIPVAPSKREVIEIPSEKHEMLWFSKLDLVCVDGGPHKPTGPAFIPGIVRSSDELAECQRFFPAIRFHNVKYRPGERAPAIRCFTHAGHDESGARLPHDDFWRAHYNCRGTDFNYANVIKVL